MQFDANSMPVGVGVVGLDGSFLWGSDKLKDELGLVQDTPLDFTFQDITFPEDLEEDLRNVDILLSGQGESYEMEKRYVIGNQDPFWVNLGVSLNRTATGQPERFTVCIKNIHEKKEHEKALRSLAYQDSVSGLPNRHAFMEKANALMARFKTGQLLVFGIADMNNLKSINDAHGHAAGDQAIAVVGNRLQQQLGDAGIVTRLGGDEFGLIVSTGTPQAVRLLNEGLYATQATISGADLNLTASVGFALYHAEGTDLGTLLKLADRRMYEKKASGGFEARSRPRFISTV